MSAMLLTLNQYIIQHHHSLHPNASPPAPRLFLPCIVFNYAFDSLVMSLEQLLREENCHLKNEITDLKNVFDINRDILRLIAHHDNPNDHEHRLLLQIITKLTAINNDALIANLQLSHEKSVLKEENLRVNMELNRLQKRFMQEMQEVKEAHFSTDPTTAGKEVMNIYHQLPEIKTEMQETSQIINNLESQQKSKAEVLHKQSDFGTVKRKRKYTQVQSIKMEENLKQTQKQINALKRYIEELENRLILFVKAYNLEEEIKEKVSPYMLKEREESELVKYALKDIKVVKKDGRWLLRVNNRINSNEESARLIEDRSKSWPKHKDYALSPQLSPKGHIVSMPML